MIDLGGDLDILESKDAFKSNPPPKLKAIVDSLFIDMSSLLIILTLFFFFKKII